MTSTPELSPVVLVIGLLIYFGLLLFALTCMWIVFKKAGKPGWAAIIPIYNTAVLCQIAGYSGWLVLLFFIPIIDIIVEIFVCLGIAKNFGRGTLFGIGLLFLSPIFYAIIAFSKSIQYNYAAPVSPSATAATPTATPASSTREYYEKKAATFDKPGAPVELKTTMTAGPRVSAATPLPPLSPQIDETTAQEHFVRAGEMEAKGEKEKAIEHYTKAIRLNSKHTVAYFKRGMLLMEMNFKPAAVADFRRVIEFADNPELSHSAKENIAKLV